MARDPFKVLKESRAIRESPTPLAVAGPLGRMDADTQV